MAQSLTVHANNPQARIIGQAVASLRRGGIIAYPTDSCYALGCCLDNKAGADHIRQIRKLDHNHHFTLLCRDLSELGTYAVVDNPTYRMLKHLTPGPYTFILRATREVPRRLQHPKRHTIGLRVPDHPVTRGLLEHLGEPMMSISLILPGMQEPETEPEEIVRKIGHTIDLVVDSGLGSAEPTTVVDLTGADPVIIRQGKGVFPVEK